MAKLNRETVRGEEEVWVHGTRERTNAAGTRAENLERPRRHVLEKVSIGEESLSGRFEVYSTRGV